MNALLSTHTHKKKESILLRCYFQEAILKDSIREQFEGACYSFQFTVMTEHFLFF